ncbi:MAG: AAA family ATPase [Bacteroidota bacterium]
MDHIKIKGYKSIKSLDLALSSVNILIGANGSGKSNFVSFFKFLNNLYHQNLAQYVSLNGGVEKFLFQGRKVTASITGEISINNGNRKNGYWFSMKPGESGFVFTNERLSSEKEDWSLARFSTESSVKLDARAEATSIKKYLGNLRLYHFQDTGRQSPFNSLSNIENDIHFLYEDGQNLAAYLYHIREKHKFAYKRIIKTIQSIAPFFSDFYLEANREGYIQLQWQDKSGNLVFGTRDLSDGTLRFIALTTLFLQPNLPQAIIIDEPELGLHPFAIAKLAGLIKSASTRGCKIILATQSSDLISYFSPEDIITVDQKHGASVFNKLSKSELEYWLNEYSLGDLWRKNIISGAQPVID